MSSQAYVTVMTLSGITVSVGVPSILFFWHRSGAHYYPSGKLSPVSQLCGLSSKRHTHCALLLLNTETTDCRQPLPTENIAQTTTNQQQQTELSMLHTWPAKSKTAAHFSAVCAPIAVKRENLSYNYYCNVCLIK